MQSGSCRCKIFARTASPVENLRKAFAMKIVRLPGFPDSLLMRRVFAISLLAIHFLQIPSLLFFLPPVRRSNPLKSEPLVNHSAEVAERKCARQNPKILSSVPALRYFDLDNSRSADIWAKFGFYLVI